MNFRFLREREDKVIKEREREEEQAERFKVRSMMEKTKKFNWKFDLDSYLLKLCERGRRFHFFVVASRSVILTHSRCFFSFLMDSSFPKHAWLHGVVILLDCTENGMSSKTDARNDLRNGPEKTEISPSRETETEGRCSSSSFESNSITSLLDETND